MSVSNLKRTPTTLRMAHVHGNCRSESPEAWMYEEAQGLTVVVSGVANFVIPWPVVREAVKRRDKGTKKAQRGEYQGREPR